MTKTEALYFARKRLVDLRSWFVGALNHFEARPISAVQAAVNHFVSVARGTDPEGEGWYGLWASVEDDLMVGLGQELTNKNLTIHARHFLGEATPSWELWEVPLVVGLVLTGVARNDALSRSWERHIRSGVLMADAVEAQHAWICNRGIARCRNPDDRFVQLDRAVDDLVVKLGRKKLAKQNAIKSHADSNAARDWVYSEWLAHREAYGENKTKFAEDYSRRVLHEFNVKVSTRQIREVWVLRDRFASKPAGLPADR